MQDELDEEIENVKILLSSLHDYAKANNGRYPSEQVISFVRERLASVTCRNQGYVLDGFGSTSKDLMSLFPGSVEDDEEKKANVPSFVISLECSEEVCKDRFVNSYNPETHEGDFPRLFWLILTLIEYLSRCENFKKDNQAESAIINFFDEHDILPLTLHTDKMTVEQCGEASAKHIGQPRNFGLSHKEYLRQQEQQRLAAQKKQEDAEKEDQRQEKLSDERKALAENELVNENPRTVSNCCLEI